MDSMIPKMEAENPCQLLVLEVNNPMPSTTPEWLIVLEEEVVVEAVSLVQRTSQVLLDGPGLQ